MYNWVYSTPLFQFGQENRPGKSTSSYLPLFKSLMKVGPRKKIFPTYLPISKIQRNRNHTINFVWPYVNNEPVSVIIAHHDIATVIPAIRVTSGFRPVAKNGKD